MKNLCTDRLVDAKSMIDHATDDQWLLPKKALMVTPQYFKIEYSINPYMRDEAGRLKVVDTTAAVKQWNSLKSTYESLGIQVETINGEANLPDMVFAANQSLVFWHNQRPHVILSRMKAAERRPEVDCFENWFRANNYVVTKFENPDVFCEGNGDVLLDPKFRLFWGAIGPRTNTAAYHELSQRFQIPVINLHLKSNDFYHLDTCFSILNQDTVAIQPEAFDQEALQIVKYRFKNVIEINYQENKTTFAGNCHSPNGTDVILHKGSQQFVKDLKARGLRAHEVDTEEFIKSGGSVFCMKMMVFSA